jgi:ABC-type oligopeptide transport system substrate-binding subunit
VVTIDIDLLRKCVGDGDMKRAVLIGVSAVALVAGPLSVVSVTAAAPAYACPWGTVPSHFEGVCVKGTANGSGPQSVPPQTSNSGTGAQITQSVGGLQTVNGIPCTPEHIGTCIGLIQSQQ